MALGCSSEPLDDSSLAVFGVNPGSMLRRVQTYEFRSLSPAMLRGQLRAKYRESLRQFENVLR